jgi:hypothetical protein
MGRVNFEVGELFRNRIGFYKVLEINGDKMKVRYLTDVTETTLSKSIQDTIVGNIRLEEERKGRSIALIAKDRETFFYYVDVCEKEYRSAHDLSLYRGIIARHRSNVGLDSLLDSDDFNNTIWETLKAWNMDQRGAELTTLSKLRTSILSNRGKLVALSKYKLNSLTDADTNSIVLPMLRSLFLGLHVMESKRRIVGVSKTLHFLLPDLVMPIDGTYTLPYFYGYNRYDSTPEGECTTFENIFKETLKITEQLHLTPIDASGRGWNTAIPKLIDNAIIGLFKDIERLLNAKRDELQQGE